MAVVTRDDQPVAVITELEASTGTWKIPYGEVVIPFQALDDHLFWNGTLKTFVTLASEMHVRVVLDLGPKAKKLTLIPYDPEYRVDLSKAIRLCGDEAGQMVFVLMGGHYPGKYQKKEKEANA